MPDRKVRFANPTMAEGFTQVPNVILRDATLSAGARMTWALLASYAWNTDESWPGQQTLGDQLGVGDRQIRNNLTELEEANLIEVRRTGNRKSNTYILHEDRNHSSAADAHDRKSGSAEEDTSSVPSKKKPSSSGEQQQCLDGVGAPEDEAENPIRKVFEKWNDLYGSPRTKLTDKRRARIKSRLDDGRTAEELCEALEGAKHDGWLMGTKEGSPGYTGIDTLLRDDDQVVRLIKLHTSGGSSRPTKRKSYERDPDQRAKPGW